MLDELVERLKASTDARIIIEGHSDRSGPPRFNRELSRMRASTVRYHLFQRGVAWHRMWLAPGSPPRAPAAPWQTKRTKRGGHAIAASRCVCCAEGSDN